MAEFIKLGDYMINKNAIGYCAYNCISNNWKIFLIKKCGGKDYFVVSDKFFKENFEEKKER